MRQPEFVGPFLEDMTKFIRDWNGGDGSKIACYSNFFTALSMDKKQDAAFGAAARRAADIGIDNFQEHIRLDLEPVIFGTFIQGCLRASAKWAAELVDDDPPEDCPAPFASEEEWIDWACANVDQPLEFCGPYGEVILEDETIAFLLKQALHAERTRARRSGWLSSPIVRLK